MAQSSLAIKYSIVVLWLPEVKFGLDVMVESDAAYASVYVKASLLKRSLALDVSVALKLPGIPNWALRSSAISGQSLEQDQLTENRHGHPQIYFS